MLFFILAVIYLSIGRTLGWALSRSLLYTVRTPVLLVLGVAWGVLVAGTMRGLINWQEPGTILRWVMGYALGAYVAVPNYGLLNESTIPPEAALRHQLVFLLPLAAYVGSAVVLAWRFPYP